MIPQVGIQKLLLAIYQLSRNGQPVHVMELVSHLNSSRQNVAMTLSRAKAQGFVYNPQRGYWKLTDSGLRVVEEILRLVKA